MPERQLSALWDGPWRGEATRTDSGYTAEMFLPWSMMAMPEGVDQRHMGVAVTRRVAYLDEEWGWPALPSSKAQFMSALQSFELGEVSPRRQLAVFPFASTTTNRIREEQDYRIGTDVFWRPSSALQLTATLNPDFGAVESDDVVVNLTAFETFFPEKRLFFLEGNDVFITSSRSAPRAAPKSTGARSLSNNFFSPPQTLVNTRRIGGTAPEPAIPAGVSVTDIELGQPTELKGAAKVTGQWGGLRYGVMTAMEDDALFYGTRDSDGAEVLLRQEGRDFNVLRMLYESTASGRKSIGMIATRVAHPVLGDAETWGIDLQHRTPSGRLSTEVQLLSSDVDGNEGYGGWADIAWIPRQGVFTRLSVDYLDDQLDINDLGFLQRNDQAKVQAIVSLRTSKLSWLRQMSTTISGTQERNTDWLITRGSFYVSNGMTFHNRSKLTSTMIAFPASWDDRLTEGNGTFRKEAGGIVNIAYGTDTSRVLSWAASMNMMREALGDDTLMAQAGITYKPIDRLSFELDLMYRKPRGWLIHLTGPTLATYSAEHWQPSLSMDLFLSARQQLRFSLQWVGIRAEAEELWRVPDGGGNLVQLTDGITTDAYDFAISRMAAQLRYRWEIAPLSDLFVVYTRGSNVPSDLTRGADFDSLFGDALTKPAIDMIVLKLRYRFGS